ncbi:hypothetical protein UFOVP965_69 [uncultured Caudovirales phage]|uniref:Uncharacterized protein n=1 Tax=uncultured Caudovirales phage TaxID=2100421 RepID=A0A6J5Q6A1_9CAUD|nr:hypothetical protein UFOVP965_69 [uncultured Caudovirales phage]CAB4179819.1 hypothetical protein UFOVP1035_65 [uncultured Caudovirales phage]CAB4188462.1 hypothetical protein UFOVP1181_24 [uncultured Caudovirales phage]
MLDILQKHINQSVKVECIVAKWVNVLPEEEQQALEKLRTSYSTVYTDLYRDLSNSVVLPFRITAFRSHMKGYCACQK